MARFVVHFHQAKTEHYDLRLEMDYVLKSWAIPKDIRLAEKKRLLAVPTTDHPMEYLNFEGVIEKGAYGAGQVKIWDTGTYDLVERKSDKIVVDLHGKNLKGKYALIQFTDKRGKKNWLFFKMKGG